MRHLYVTFLLVLTTSLGAQPFSIGTRSLTFTDAARNRDIPCEVHYPALTAGTGTEVAEGPFPVLVHGHGFVMAVDAYTNLRDYFVPRGYILVLPTTEGGFAPGHANFGADLAFLAGAMQDAGMDVASPFFGRVAPATALLGHSMGGGASFLGAANNADIQALVNFAPAETNPSAIDAAAQVLVPTLVFAATEDCVTPAESNQSPMYAAVAVPCKAFVNVVGGGHCYFGASSLTCSLGELTCGPDLTISREQQHDVMNDFAGLWLDHFLKDEVEAIGAFRDSVLLSTRVIAETTCLTTGLPHTDGPGWSLVPVPAADLLGIVDAPVGATAEVFDALGRPCHLSPLTGPSLDISGLPNGSYTLRLSTLEGRSVRTFVVWR